MNKTLATFRYLLKGFTSLAFIAFSCILANIAITNLIYHLTARYNGPRQVVPLTAPIEATAAIFALITGTLLFLINFNVALANGVSRKSYLRANLLAAAVLAAGLALFNLLVFGIHSLFWPVVGLSHLFFPNISWAGLLLLQFAQYLLFIIAGWLITLAYYRTGTAGRWAISLAPFALIGLYLTANAQSGGALGSALNEFWRLTMRSSPIMASLSQLVFAAILAGVVYLLFRRAPVKG